jgi:hypothetical protein
MALLHTTVPARETEPRAPHSSELRRILLGIAPIIALYIVYSIVRWALSDRGPKLGPTHALDILDFEGWFRIDFEQGLQARLLDHVWLIKTANWYYAYGFLPILVGAALLSVWRAPGAFYYWRRVFSISMVMALAGFALYPLAPPRLLPPSFGFVDTLLLYGPRYYGDHTGDSLFNFYGRIPSTVNVYAAMPSMHVAWSVIAGALLVAVIGRNLVTMTLASLHPCFMAAAVVITANHYVLDVVAGLVVLAIALWLTRYWNRSRPLQPARLVS